MDGIVMSPAEFAEMLLELLPEEMTNEQRVSNAVQKFDDLLTVVAVGEHNGTMSPIEGTTAIYTTLGAISCVFSRSEYASFLDQIKERVKLSE